MTAVPSTPADGSSPPPTQEAPTTGAPGTWTERLVDVVGLALLAFALRLPAYLSSRHLTFDDGVFASSVIAMRDGGAPFRDVFSSQGPLFLPLVYVGDLLGGRSLDAPRVVAVASGIAVTLGLYWCGRQIGGRAAGVLAGVLAATSGCLMWVTGPLAADGPALAFAVFAVGVALSMDRHRGLGRAAAMGLLVGATLSTKSLEAPVLAPVAMVLLAPVVRPRGTPVAGAAPRPWARTATEVAVAALGAVVVYLVVTLPFGFAEVWDQSFRYRADAATDRDLWGNAAKIASTLWDRDLVLLAFLVLSAACAARRRWLARRQPAARPVSSEMHLASWSPTPRALVVVWLAVTWLWLVFMVSPLWRPHVSAMVPPLVLVVVLWRPPTRVALVAGLACLPLLWLQLDGLLRPGGYTGGEAEVVGALERLPQGAWALSDEPGLVWRAGRRTTDDLVDPSMLRVRQGRYTEDSVVDAAADPRVCAVAIRSSERFGSFPGLPGHLSSEGYELVARDGPDGALYVRTLCTPSS